MQSVAAASQAPSASEQGLEKALAQRGVKLIRVSAAEAEAQWQGGKLAALLEGAAGAPRLRINSYLAAQGFQIEALVQQAYLQQQAQQQGLTLSQRVAVDLQSPGGRHAAHYVAFLLPGLLGLNLMMMGVFGTTMSDVALREKGGYKRLAATPLPKSIFLGAQLVVRFIIVLIGAAALMACGALAFGVSNQGSYGTLVLLLLLGAACFISLGYVLGSVARTVESSNGLANLVSLPLMLLSGVYFSLDGAPQWLQSLVQVLPLAPLLRALRAVFNDGASLSSQSHALWLVSVWSLGLFLLAVRRFRWQ